MPNAVLLSIIKEPWSFLLDTNQSIEVKILMEDSLKKKDK